MQAIKAYSPSQFPKPPEEQIEATARKLPGEILRQEHVPLDGQQYQLTVIEIVDCLVAAGESEAHAVHAIHHLVNCGLLSETRTPHAQVLTTTPAFWELWRLNEPQAQKMDDDDDIRLHLNVKVAHEDVFFCGEPHKIRSEKARRFLNALLKKPGVRVRSTEWPNLDPQLIGEIRPKRLAKLIGEKIYRYVDAKPGLGTMILPRLSDVSSL